MSVIRKGMFIQRQAGDGVLTFEDTMDEKAMGYQLHKCTENEWGARYSRMYYHSRQGLHMS